MPDTTVPGSIGYEGQPCQRCLHLRAWHTTTNTDTNGSVTGACHRTDCTCNAFQETP